MDPALETLLAEYRSSVGSEHGGVPSEILQGAARIAPEHASVNTAGPAQCVPQGDEEPGIRDGTPVEVVDDPGGNSGAVLDGGVDDL